MCLIYQEKYELKVISYLLLKFLRNLLLYIIIVKINHNIIDTIIEIINDTIY